MISQLSTRISFHDLSSLTDVLEKLEHESTIQNQNDNNSPNANAHTVKDVLLDMHRRFEQRFLEQVDVVTQQLNSIFNSTKHFVFPLSDTVEEVSEKITHSPLETTEVLEDNQWKLYFRESKQQKLNWETQCKELKQKTASTQFQIHALCQSFIDVQYQKANSFIQYMSYLDNSINEVRKILAANQQSFRLVNQSILQQFNEACVNIQKEYETTIANEKNKLWPDILLKQQELDRTALIIVQKWIHVLEQTDSSHIKQFLIEFENYHNVPYLMNLVFRQIQSCLDICQNNKHYQVDEDDQDDQDNENNKDLRSDLRTDVLKTKETSIQQSLDSLYEQMEHISKELDYASDLPSIQSLTQQQRDIELIISSAEAELKEVTKQLEQVEQEIHNIRRQEDEALKLQRQQHIMEWTDRILQIQDAVLIWKTHHELIESAREHIASTIQQKSYQTLWKELNYALIRLFNLVKQCIPRTSLYQSVTQSFVGFQNYWKQLEDKDFHLRQQMVLTSASLAQFAESINAIQKHWFQCELSYFYLYHQYLNQYQSS